jgi:hypothetical protein
MGGKVKILRAVETAILFLFSAQLTVALGATFFPPSRVLYPVPLGFEPWSMPHLGANLLLLTMALAAMYWADRLDPRDKNSRSRLSDARTVLRSQAE